MRRKLQQHTRQSGRPPMHPPPKCARRSKKPPLPARYVRPRATEQSETQFPVPHTHHFETPQHHRQYNALTRQLPPHICIKPIDAFASPATTEPLKLASPCTIAFTARAKKTKKASKQEKRKGAEAAKSRRSKDAKAEKKLPQHRLDGTTRNSRPKTKTVRTQTATREELVLAQLRNESSKKAEEKATSSARHASLTGEERRTRKRTEAPAKSGRKDASGRTCKTG